jgi:hypothetical protein
MQPPHRSWLRVFLCACTCLFAIAASSLASAQLRVANWNISHYNGGRIADLTNAIYGEFEGRSMSPHAILVQEFNSEQASIEFLQMLNSAPGSPGTWARAPFVKNGTMNNTFFYRSDLLQLLDTVVVAEGGPSPDQPRNIMRFDVRLKGYFYDTHHAALYSTHWKAGTNADDYARRLLEATRIRNNAASLPNGFHYILGGDFNIRTSNENSYQKLVAEPENPGRFFDPIASPGGWNKNVNFRFVHTQDPTGTGGMDDRYDFLLLSPNLVDGQGFTYLGNPMVPFSNTTWNDPSHSFRTWGNDGTSYEQQLRVDGNTMVGASIAQSLRNVATQAGGHLPIFLDLLVPPEVRVLEEHVPFGIVLQGSEQSRIISVFNGGDTTLWREGVSPLHYSFSSSGVFGGPTGTFVHHAGDAPNTHPITLDTATPGEHSGEVAVGSTVSGVSARTVTFSATVIPSQLSPTAMSVIFGTVIAGNLQSLLHSDDQRLVIARTFMNDRSSFPIELEVTGTSPIGEPSSLRLTLEAHASMPLTQQRIQFYNFALNRWDVVDVRFASTVDSVTIVTHGGGSAYVQPQTRQIRAKLSWNNVDPTASRNWNALIDQVFWTAIP